jgi:hypothetical protein
VATDRLDLAVLTADELSQDMRSAIVVVCTGIIRSVG